MPTPLNLLFLQDSLPFITAFFDASSQNVYKQIDLSRLLTKYQAEWDLNSRVSIKAFINFLCEQSDMERVGLVFGETKSRKETRYIWGETSIYELALSLKKKSYFTHHTAAYLHGLTSHFPRTVYLNFEQTKRSISSELTQEAIDNAFKNSVRISHYLANYGQRKICLLNGMYTGELGVIESLGEKGEKLRFTDVERTLIDIAVRPVYSGGVMEVLEIYKNAKKKISVSRLAETIKKLGYVYPYHQVVGFYLERAGLYTEKDVNLFDEIDKKFNFYLTHKMGETAYSEKWRLFYPKEFDSLK